MDDAYRQVVEVLPDFLAKPLGGIDQEVAGQIHEIRLRTDCLIWVNLNGSLCPAAQLPGCPAILQTMRLTQVQLEQVFYCLCNDSVHTHQNELAQGYVTLPGGHRVGVGGKYLIHPEEGIVLQTVHSLNVRIARIKQTALPWQLVQQLKGHFIGMLISGEPDSGKTTLLRTMISFLAQQGKAVSVIDEREELWPSSCQHARPPVDFIAGLPKGQAVQMALRTLAPQILVLDELGDMEEVRQLEQGFFSGVDYIASLHASSLEDAFRRPQVMYMKQEGMLRVVVQLTGRQAPGRIQEVTTV